MPIKNKIFFTTIFLFFSLNVYADEFNISAKEIIIDKTNNTVTGLGGVNITDKEGMVIKANKVIYEKSKEFLTTTGSVEVIDNEGNTLKAENVTYDKINEMVKSYGNSQLNLEGGYELNSSTILYDTVKKIISTEKKSILNDIDGNQIETSMFQYFISKNLFSSIGKIKIIDINKNKYFFKELHIDTKRHEIIGSDASVLLDPESFGVSEESEPRFVANDIFVSKNKTNLSKGIFTTCKRKGEKCPAWSLQAKKISHDKIKKTIFYDHAVLKVYNVPIFYFPKFFHPDPTVKRQSGFLSPFFTNTTSAGFGVGTPYYWAISENKDLTFTTKTYAEESMLFFNEYRQAFKNGFLTLDTSYTQGYKESSATKSGGSRSHVFANLNLSSSAEKNYQSNLSMKLQRVNNDTFFKIHDVNTALVDADTTNLESSIIYNFNKDGTNINISGTIFEDLDKQKSDRFEYILPKFTFEKAFSTEKFGILNLKSDAFYKSYDTNKTTAFLTNDIKWSPNSFVTKKGFVNSFESMIRNTNYESTKTTDYKTDKTVNELSGVLSFKSSLPMQKENSKFLNIFSPTYMIRYAPGHMKHLGGDDLDLNYNNLFALNKTSVIEDGLSAIIGFDYKINEKGQLGDNKEKFALSIGQIFSLDENKDIPSKSSLDQKTSDVVGEMNYNFSKIGSVGYKFSLDHNLNDINYNEISTNFDFGKIDFNLDYLEERNHIGNEHYVNSGISLAFNENNKLSFSTKKNFKTSSTELYNVSYQYAIDCLTAGLVFRREFYEDTESDIEPKDSLMFIIRFVPFTGVRAPVIN